MSGSAARPVVAVVYAEATAPVVHAQTVPLLHAMREAGRRVDVAVFASPRRLVLPGVRAAHARAFASLSAATGAAPMVFTHRPRQRSFVRSGASLADALRDRGLADAVLLCRQPRATLVGLAARENVGAGLGVVLDLRGLRDVEYLMSVGRDASQLTAAERSRLEGYREREAQACTRADAVLCVSRPMVREIRKRHGLPEDRTVSVPNHARPIDDAEELRVRARNRLGVGDDEILVTYQGTVAAWQMAEEAALLMATLGRQLDGVRTMFLTPDTAAARDAIARTELTDVLLESAPPGKVHHTLAAADYGLLLRRDDPVNRVACPVKFGEYLACGVRPVLTPRIGDQSELCARERLGTIVRADDAGEAARQVAADAAGSGALTVEGRARRREWAREHISPSRAAARVLAVLDRCGQEPA